MKKKVIITILICIISSFLLIYFIYLIVLVPPNDKRKITIIKMQELEIAISSYLLENNRYPSKEEGLFAIIKYVNNDIDNLKDSWGNYFLYIIQPDDNIPYDIVSYGEDGKLGGEGINEDIHLSKNND